MLRTGSRNEKTHLPAVEGGTEVGHAGAKPCRDPLDGTGIFLDGVVEGFVDLG